jgi:hypothetical protein
MDIRGIPNEQVNTGDAFEHQRKVARTDSKEASIQKRHLNRAAEVDRLPSSDLVRLAAVLKGVPEIREDVVSQVRARMKTGYYVTRAASEKTAEVLNQK